MCTVVGHYFFSELGRGNFGLRGNGEAIYGMDGQGDEELVAQDEGEQAERVQFLPIFYQRTNFEYSDHYLTHVPYQA